MQKPIYASYSSLDLSNSPLLLKIEKKPETFVKQKHESPHECLILDFDIY